MMDDREERAQLLKTPERYSHLGQAAEDAKSRLDRMRLHDPVIAAVSDHVFSLSLRERRFVREDEYYALLAWELTKRNAELMDRILETSATTVAPIILKTGG